MLMSRSITRQPHSGNVERNAETNAGDAVLETIKTQAAKLKQEVTALYFAARDPRTPWYARVLIAAVVAYALSPIDLIPDPIPIFGYLDDLVLLPLGIWLAVRLIPPAILHDCRAKAASADLRLPRNWWAAAVIVLLWLATLALAAHYVAGKLSRNAPPGARVGY
jgi:uncharacterized membrane protein YkvA (DUF1232 family)